MSSTRHQPPRARSGTPPEAHEARFRILVESVKDYAIFMLDPGGFVQTWNEGAKLIKGYEPGEIVGRHLSQFYTPEDRARKHPEHLLAQAMASGRAEDEGWRLRKDGSRFWADVVIAAVRDATGVLTGFAKVTRDLTERKNAELERARREEELRRSEERFRLMVDGVQDYAIFMLDLNGLVTSWNSGAQRMMGYQPQEIIGRHFSLFRVSDDLGASRCDAELAAAARDGRLEGEGWRLRKDESRFWAHMILTAIRDASGELVGFAKVTRDLTERRRLDEERVARVRAEEAVRLKDDFLAIAAHELRTPLTALQIELQGLQETVKTEDPRILKKLARARHTGNRLAALVESLLDVGRIATGRLTLSLERFDLAQAVVEVVDSLRESAARAGSDLKLGPLPVIEGRWDRLRVEQVVMNVLANAFKYGAGAPVDVSLSRDGDEAVIEIADHGPGIGEQDLERIFGRFERAAPRRHYGGLGLGLYVSREIVGALNGMISARNLAGGGAAFMIRLPIESDTQAERPGGG
ncbi:MAG TPA: PAS domain-containing sensor histidine kinase [Polyangia bacterium]|nr:PAS domain-containing sensor histidine kinase [Polyangia bacterium]